MDILDASGKSILRSDDHSDYHDDGDEHHSSHNRIPLYATAFALSPGPKGDKGDPGPQGMQGPMGLIGPQGPPGPALPNLAFTNVSNMFSLSQTINGSLILSGSGNGVRFPDGTTQTTAATGALSGVPSGSIILGNSATPPAGYTSSGILGGTNLWYPGPGLAVNTVFPSPAAFPAAAVIADQIYVAGSVFDPVTHTGVFIALDPLSNVWTTKAPVPASLSRSAAATLNGKLYLFGGSPKVPTSTSNAIYEYDPGINQWLNKGVLPSGITGLAAVTTLRAGTPLIFLLGGLDASGLSIGNINTFDGTKLRSAGSILPRDSFAAAELNGKIYVFGGFSTLNAGLNGTTCTAQSEVFDTGDFSTQRIASLPTPLADAAAASIGGKIYVIGGSVGTVGNPQECQSGTLNNSVFVYDPATDSWTTAPAMPTARVGLAAVTANGRIFALGGESLGFIGAPTSVVEEFAPPIYILVKN